MNNLISYITLVMGICILAIVLWVEGITRAVRRFFHFPIPAVATRLIDNPVRRVLQPPEQVVQWIGIEKGMNALEVGPGPGTFTIEASHHVGDGIVYTIDIQLTSINALRKRLKRHTITNVKSGVASAYDLPFPDKLFDRVFMITVLPEIPDRQRALKEVRRVLKDEGLLALGEFLPDPDYPLKRTVITWCKNSGFELVDVHGGIFHYLLRFKKIDRDQMAYLPSTD